MGMYRSDVADNFACSVMDAEAMSGEGLVGRAITGTLARGVVYDELELSTSA